MKRIATVFTLGAFVFYSWSCITFHSTRQESAEKAAAKLETKIVGVQLKSGKYIEFLKNDPASVRGDAVVGRTPGAVELSRDEIKLTKERTSDRSIEEIETKDGRIFRGVTSATFQGDKILFKAYLPISIPLSDVQLAWVRTVNVVPTIAVNVGIVLVVVVGVVGLALAKQGGLYGGGGSGGGSYDRGGFASCPFIYSYDGEQYVFDAEPYGTAVCRGLKRTDFIEMNHLKTAGGEYKIMLTNQLNETEYTDELKLIAVDHPSGVTVVPDTLGRVHTFASPLPPRKATDQSGRDILPLTAQNDKSFWVTDPDAKDPAKTEDLRDELTFEFAKPAEARQAKLLVNAWTTMWGTAIADRLLELRGRTLPAWYDDVNRHGSEFYKVMKWFTNEELYLLKIWVETKDGWQVRGVIPGGEPRLTKDKAFVLDIGDVPGDTLKVKLRPPVNFWMVNSLAVDYSRDLPVETTEIAALKATDQEGRDVRAQLAALDDAFLVTPNSGGRAEIVFPAPPPKDGRARTILLKAVGYYDIQIDTTAEPRLGLFDRAENEPGFAARYALEEYKKWEAALRAKIEKR